MNKRAIISVDAPDPEKTPLALIMGDSNADAAATLCGLLWLLFLVHTVLLPKLHSLVVWQSAKRSTKHSTLAVSIHRLLLGEFRFLGLHLTSDSATPLISIFTLLLLFSLNVSLDPKLSDIGMQRMATLAMPLLSFSMSTALRNSPLTLLGVSPAAALSWHRWSGVAATAILLAHGVSYWCQWVHFDFVLGNLGMVRNQWGLGGLCLLVLLYLTSLPIIRRKAYTIFYTLHVLVIPVLLTMTYLHAPKEALPYLSPSLGFYILDKALRLVKSQRRVKVLQLASFSDQHADTSLITVCAPPLCSEAGFSAGQYLFLNVPEVSTTKWHPVSFASSPIPTHPSKSSTPAAIPAILPTSASKPALPLNCCQKEKCGITIVLSGPGPFCRSVNDAVAARLINTSISPLQVRVDGPYGGHGKLGLYNHIFGKFIYVAGGVGVTPILSMLMDRKHAVIVNAATASP
ncbi:UNVERIFIED_CONTAM: hypothetical protein HDU68_005284, partial [Siphonaria sp. JEL0065]